MARDRKVGALFEGAAGNSVSMTLFSETHLRGDPGLQRTAHVTIRLLVGLSLVVQPGSSCRNYHTNCGLGFGK
jgi:hypothetical protein